MKKSTLGLCALGIFSVMPAKAIPTLTQDCVQTISSSLPSGFTLTKRDYYEYFGTGTYGKDYGLPDYITKIRSGEDEPWSSCTELSGYSVTYQCGNRVRIQGSIPGTYSMDVTVLDRNGRDFRASDSGSKKFNCTLLKVVSTGNGYLRALGFEDEVRKYTVNDAGFTFYALIREFFALPATNSANF